MDNDRPTDQLLHRMLAAVVGAAGGDEHVERLIGAARSEAEAEVKELLKSAIKATLLQRAVARLEDEAGATAPPAPDVAAPAPAPAAPPSPPPARAVPPGEGLRACYVYGITRADGVAEVLADVEGVDPTAPPRLVRAGDLCAVVSRIDPSAFDPAELGRRAADLKWVEQKVRAHDRVVKHLLEAGPVVPCRFCTVLRGEDDVRAVLERHHDGLRASLDALDGRAEWGVKVFATPAAEPEGAGAAASEPATGRAYFLQKRRDELARTEAARAAREAVDAIHRELSAAAAGSALLPAHDRGIGTPSPDLMLNGAYLVDRTAAPDFHARIDALAAHCASLGLTFDLTGPWPPYNFVSLDLSLTPDPSPGAHSAARREMDSEAAA